MKFSGTLKCVTFEPLLGKFFDIEAPSEVTKPVEFEFNGTVSSVDGESYTSSITFTKIGDEEVDISYQTTDIYLDANVQEEAVAAKQVASLMIGLDKFQITDIVCLNPIKPEPEPDYPEGGETDVDIEEGH